MDEATVIVDRPAQQVVVADRTVPGLVVDRTTAGVLADRTVAAAILDRTVSGVVAVGQQGPAGPQGDIGPAGGSAITVTAGTALSGHRIVYLDASYKAQYASNQTASHALIALGLTLGAAALDETVSVQRSGEVTEPSWSWTLEQPVYLGDNGLLTQTAPTNPALFQRIVGFPTAATKLFLALREPVFIL